MTEYFLKDAIRWFDRGDKLVLQVLRLHSNGQGTIDEIWEDVLIVTPENPLNKTLRRCG